MWDLPRSGLEPVSPALAGGFLTAVPPGKPCWIVLMMKCINTCNAPNRSWPIVNIIDVLVIVITIIVIIRHFVKMGLLDIQDE